MQASQWSRTIPGIDSLCYSINRSFQTYDVILRPDRSEPDWWAGAPSVVRDKTGVFWLACRMRTTESPLGQRGYEIRILRSQDGVHFEKVHHILREEVPIPGFERPCLLIDSRTGLFKLYGCGPWNGGSWTIMKWEDAASPVDFIASSATPVIQAIEKTYSRDVIPTDYKDPFIFQKEGIYHCYTIGYLRQNEFIFHHQSHDGIQWEPVGSPYEPIMSLSGWHNFFVRPACVLPLGVGFLFIYEGSSSQWYDPVYNIATGLAFTFDGHQIIDLTPAAPCAVSPTPSEYFSTFRYSHWLRVENEIWIYAEVACPDQTNEIRRFRLPME